MESLKASGVDHVAFIIDAPEATDHDSFRQVPGSYDLSLQDACWAKELEIPLQINTVFHRVCIPQPWTDHGRRNTFS